MIQDALCTMAAGLAHGGTATPVDLKIAGTGVGTPKYINFNGHSLVGATGINILSGASAVACTDVIATHTIALASLNEGVSVMIPMNVGRFVSLSLTGSTSGGTYTASISENQGQTHK